METLAGRHAEIQARLDQSATKHGIPGMAFGVLAGDESLELGTGVVNVETRVETTPDALFQIGSITKMYTATLVMQLVGRGEVDLDASVLRYLPELRLKGNPDLDGITVKHLLTHTSGIEGDCYFDTGRSDDAVEKPFPGAGAMPRGISNLQMVAEWLVPSAGCPHRQVTPCNDFCESSR